MHFHQPELPDFNSVAGFLTVRAQSSCEQHASFEEDELMAALFGKCALPLVVGRIKRTFYAFNVWSHRCLQIQHHDPAHKHTITNEFRADYEVFQAMRDRDPSNRDLDDIVARSSFSLVNAMQFVNGFEAVG